MRERLRRRARIWVTVAAAGIAYAVICLHFGVGIPCPIYALTGFRCPGCGVSRMMLSLIRGNVAGMFRYNLVLPVVLPVLAVLLVRDEVNYIRYGTARAGRVHNAVCIVIIAALLIYGVVRNIPGLLPQLLA